MTPQQRVEDPNFEEIYMSLLDQIYDYSLEVALSDSELPMMHTATVIKNYILTGEIPEGFHL